uniref:Uncharacterized protein n=1 Tax=Zea mays TaxID=4577 RepID=A0A804LMM0_MAIZE
MALLPPLDLAAVARVPSVARARPGSRTTASASPSPTATLLTGERLVVFLFTTPVHLAVLLVILVAAALVVELAQDGSRCAPLRSSLPQGAERLSPCASAVADRSSAPHCGASMSPWMNATSPWMSHSSVSYRESSTPRATDTRFHSSWSGARSSAALTRSAGCTSPASSDTSLKALPGRTLPSSTMHVASSGHARQAGAVRALAGIGASRRSSKTKMQSHGPQNIEGTELREQAVEYAPVIFAHDAYKHFISFDLLSGAVHQASKWVK